MGGRGRNPHRLWTLDVSINSAEERRCGLGTEQPSPPRRGAPVGCTPQGCRRDGGVSVLVRKPGLSSVEKKGRCYLATREENTQC